MFSTWRRRKKRSNKPLFSNWGCNHFNFSSFYTVSNYMGDLNTSHVTWLSKIHFSLLKHPLYALCVFDCGIISASTSLLSSFLTHIKKMKKDEKKKAKGENLRRLPNNMITLYHRQGAGEKNVNIFFFSLFFL